MEFRRPRVALDLANVDDDIMLLRIPESVARAMEKADGGDFLGYLKEEVEEKGKVLRPGQKRRRNLELSDKCAETTLVRQLQLQSSDAPLPGRLFEMDTDLAPPGDVISDAAATAAKLSTQLRADRGEVTSSLEEAVRAAREETAVVKRARVIGRVTRVTAAVMDPKDPKYSAAMTLRAEEDAQRKKELEERRAQESKTAQRLMVAAEHRAQAMQRFDKETRRKIERRVHKEESEMSIQQARDACLERHGKVTVAGLFEFRAYWSKREMSEAILGYRRNTGGRRSAATKVAVRSEESVLNELQRLATRIPTGSRRNTYVLKDEYRTAHAAKLDSDDDE